jgi:hypothetical protein
MATAASMMADLEHSAAAGRVSLITADTFHDVSDTRPFHLPHIFHPKPGTACDNTTLAPSCAINLTTLTQPLYDSRDGLDTGLYPTCATELRAKMKSRQAVRQSAGLAATDFDGLDRHNTSSCRAINEAAWAWALQKASPAARARFARVGQPLTFGADVWSGIGITGPKWIHDALSFTPSADKRSVSVAAPYFATENANLGDKPYTDTVGYHYCKLLSPARAMEWLYVDGLLEFGGLMPSVAIQAASTLGNEFEAEEEAVPHVQSSRCPDLAPLRSVHVNGSGFHPEELDGYWYQAAYIDVAQVGASCQTLNFTGGDAGSGGLSADFRVKYGPLPFTITELYSPAGFEGGYKKHVAMPGGQLLKLPTVVVDITPETLMLFSCVDLPLVGNVIELVVATRSASPDAAVISQQLSLAQELGVPFVREDVKLSSHSRC